MASLRIKLFGEFGVWRGEDSIEGEEWGGQKPRSLLKLLLTRPGRAFSKDEIVEALWPSVSLQDADRRLRITVSLLRRALEPELGRGSDSRYVFSQRPGYSFDEKADCEVDAWKFEEHRQRAEAAQEARELDNAIREYREALNLVRGELLAEEPYEDWAIEAREEWCESQLAVLSELAECLALKGRYSEAVEALERALALDEYRDELHRRLMLYHYCAGEQGLALRTYRDYARLLKEELGAAPTPELVRLKEQIENRDVPGVDEMRRYPKPRRPLKFPYSLSRTRFVGRDGEYAWLAERLRETVEGVGGAVAVEGEAGVGKTRLAEEFLGYARSRRALVFSGRCFERELSAPLEPVLDALESLPTMDGAVLNVPDPGPGYQQETGSHDSARVYRALTRELVRKSQDDGHEGLILFVDDLQWADAATLDFLSYLARRILNERILLVFSYRREDAPGLSGWLNRLAGRRAVATLSLDRLTLRDVTEMLHRMSSKAFGELPSLADFLYRESEGNAFYAVEYLRWLIEAGIVEIDSRRRILGLESEQLHEGVLPSGVRSLLEAWLDEVGEEAKGLLELAAVVGRSFDLGLLCRAAARREAETFGLIRPLLASGLITETSEEAYYFSHDKLRQTLYEGIEGHRRRKLHLRTAKALKEEDEPAELAHHYLGAGAWRPALENLVRAGRKAEESYAWDTALKTYARALEVTEKLPGVEETSFELLGARERLLEHMDRREERGEAVREMLELAERFGDLSRIAEVHVRRIGAIAALSDLEGAEEAGRAAVALFRELEDEAGEARAHRELSYVRWMQGDYAGAQQANFGALRIHRELDDRSGEAGDAWNIAQVYRGTGDYDDALEWIEEAARIYDELGDNKLGEKLGENMRAEAMSTIHLERGDLEAALSFELEILQHNIEVGAKHHNIPQHIHCGTLYLQMGDPQEALVHFRTAAHLSREIGHIRYEGQSLMSVGISLERLGEPAGAVEALRRAVDLLETAHEEFGIEEALRAKADALVLRGRLLHHSLDRPEEALIAYETAADTHRKVSDPSRLRELLLNLSGLRWRTGDFEGSAHGYEEALALARVHGDGDQEAAALASLGVVYRSVGRFKDSLRSGRAALRLLRDLDDSQTEAYVLTSMADSHVGLGHYPSALSCLRRSLRLRRKIGDTEGEVGVLRDLAKVHEKMGDADCARASLEEAARKQRTREVVPQRRNQ